MKSREKILRLLSENKTLTTATHASVGGERTQKRTNPATCPVW